MLDPSNDLANLTDVNRWPVAPVGPAPEVTLVKNEPDDDSAGALLRPTKRPRTVVEVVVPQAKTIVEKPEDSEEDIKAKLDALKNPVFKVKKKRDIDMNLDTIHARISLIGYEVYDIQADFRFDMTSRRFMSHHYGGSAQETIPKISKAFLEKHHLNDFMYPHRDYNPQAPQIPGAPGLLYQAAPAESDWLDIQRVLVWMASGKWLYVGQYVLTPAPSLTTEEWCSQPLKVRNRWAREIHKKGWGRIVRARITLRAQLGRNPTENELDEALEKDDTFQALTYDDIALAYTSGQETMGIWCMKCVGYDEEFQRNIAEKTPNWVPPPSKKPAKSRKSGAGVPARGGKRKRAEVVDDEESDEGDVEEDLEEEEARLEDAEPVYLSKGTRTRPIQL